MMQNQLKPPSKVQLDSLLKKLKPFHSENLKSQKTLVSKKTYSEIQKNTIENCKVVQLDPESDFVYFGINWKNK